MLQIVVEAEEIKDTWHCYDNNINNRNKGAAVNSGEVWQQEQ